MSSENDGEDLRDDEDDEYRASDKPLDVSSRLPSSSVPVSQRQKRGRKAHPNPAVRTAREAARRANHSIIEKARREKINHALSELRKLVPPQPDERSVAMGSATNNATTGNTTMVQPKEYKLEVLVRTVGYLRHLIDRVETLERLTSEQCAQDGARDGTRSYQPHIPLDPKPSAGPCMPQLAVCTNCTHSLDLSKPYTPSPRFSPSSEANPTQQQRLPSLASMLTSGPPLNRQLHSLPSSDSLSTSHRGTTSSPFRSHLPPLRLPSSGLPPHQQIPTRPDTSAFPQAASHLLSTTPSLAPHPPTETRYVSASSPDAKRRPVFPPPPPRQRHARSYDDDDAISMLLNMSGPSSKGHSLASSADQLPPLGQYSSMRANSGGNSAPNTDMPSSLLGTEQSTPVGKGRRRPERQEATDRVKRTKVE